MMSEDIFSKENLPKLEEAVQKKLIHVYVDFALSF